MRMINIQRGVGLIEVMVTVLILSTSLLALAALQKRSLQFNHEAYLHSQANILAYDMIDRIRLNTDNFMDYQLLFTDDPSGSSLADEDMAAWQSRVGALLPGGEGSITCTATPDVCTINLHWTEHDISDLDASGQDTKTTFTYVTRI